MRPSNENVTPSRLALPSSVTASPLSAMTASSIRSKRAPEAWEPSNTTSWKRIVFVEPDRIAARNRSRPPNVASITLFGTIRPRWSRSATAQSPPPGPTPSSAMRAPLTLALASSTCPMSNGQRRRPTLSSRASRNCSSEPARERPISPKSSATRLVPSSANREGPIVLCTSSPAARRKMDTTCARIRSEANVVEPIALKAAAKAPAMATQARTAIRPARP
jgi:hypothetical protein